MSKYSHFLLSLISLWIFFTSDACAATKIIDLHVNYKMVNYTGKSVKAMAINDQIPGPTLHFQQGDHVIINVHNHLNVGTAMHWHGLIVPWQMDGVAMVTQRPIPPGGVFHYEYTINQAGTYWYHAHADLQEQQGLYGAYIVDPPKPTISADKDFPIVLSDWSNTPPNQIYRHLKKDGDYYASKFPLQPSLRQFFIDYQGDPTHKKMIWHAYMMMQKNRMSSYDLSDVAYDAFLLNGHSSQQPWQAKVNIGDTVRLRFIGAGASTFFHVKIPGTIMQVVQVQGNDVKPYRVKQLTIAPGETYDVLITIKSIQPYIIYAESSDTLGAAYGALVSDNKPVNYDTVKAFPLPGPMMMHGMGHQMAHDKTSEMTDQHPSMHMVGKVPHLSSSMSKYQSLVALHSTNDPQKPVHEVKMTLTGNMDRYIWMINGVSEYQAKPIIIHAGERYRFIFVNKTMMDHPMHIHGHWFILRNGHGDKDPLLHTIDVPGGATIIADFDATESGQWYFHCHNLYHMKAGMANIIRYDSDMGGSAVNRDADNKTNQNRTAFLSGHRTRDWSMAHDIELSGDFIHHQYEAELNTLLGTDHNKLQIFTDDLAFEEGKWARGNVDLFYWRPISRFWAIKGGANYVYRPAKNPYWQSGIGVEGLMPFFIATNFRGYYHAGSYRADLSLSRDTQLDKNLFFKVSVRGSSATKTVTNDLVGSGFNRAELTLQPYIQLTPRVNLFIAYEHERYYGKTKSLIHSQGGATEDETISVGLSFLM